MKPCLVPDLKYLSFELAVSMSFFVNEEWSPEIVRNLKGSEVRYFEVYWGHQDRTGATPIWKEGLYDDPNQGIGEMAQVLEEIGLPCWSLHAPHGVEYDPSSASASIRQQAQDTLHRCIEVLYRLKGKVLVVHASFEPISYQEQPARIEGAIEMLARLASECQAAGLRMAIENLPRSNLGNRAKELQYLLRGIDAPNAGVCLDFAHAFVTEGVIEMIERLRSDIITLHICDNTHPNEEMTCWPMGPDRGLIDWPPAICALKRAGYDGPAMYEIYAPRGESTQAITRLQDNYDTLLESWNAC